MLMNDHHEKRSGMGQHEKKINTKKDPEVVNTKKDPEVVNTKKETGSGHHEKGNRKWPMTFDLWP